MQRSYALSQANRSTTASVENIRMGTTSVWKFEKGAAMPPTLYSDVAKTGRLCGRLAGT